MKKDVKDTIVLVGSGVAGASLSQGAAAMLPDKFKTPVVKGAIAAVCAVGAIFMPGKGIAADAGRGALIGAAVMQGREAITGVIADKVHTDNKFVQGMLHGASAYESYDYLNPYAQENEYVEYDEVVEEIPDVMDVVS